MATLLNILIAENSPDDAELMVAQLRQAGFDPQWKRVETESDFLAELKKLPDLVLSDYSMPQFSGLRAAQLAQASGLNIPFILVSGTVGEDVAVEAMKCGATDYLLKDRVARLGNAVERALEQKRLRDEHQQTEAELRWKTALLEAQLDASIDGILVVDSRGKPVLQNRRMNELWQFPQHVLADKDDAAKLVFATNRTKNPRQFTERIAYLYAHPDAVSQDEIELIDGTVLERYSSPVRDQTGKSYGRIWSFRDITGRKQAEAALRASQALYHSLVDQMPAGIFRKDRAGRYVFANSWFCQLRGLEADQIMGRTPDELVAMEAADHRPVRPEILQLLREASKHHEEILRTGQPIHVEEVHATAEGGKRYLQVVKSAVFGPDGQIVGTQGILFDDTERKRLEAEVALREQRLNAFFTNAPAGLVLLDKHLRFVQLNETVAKINGVALKDHLGKTVGEILPELAPLAEPLLHQVLVTGEPMPSLELSGETPAQPGKPRHWLESFFPILDRNGTPDGVGVIFVEITDSKRAAEELRESELKFRQIAETINEVFWITAPAEHRLLYISPAYEKIWGRTCESLYSSPGTWLEAIHPEDRERVAQAAATQQTRGEYEEVYRILRPDGSLRWIHDRAFPLLNGTGEVYRVVGTAEDITATRQLEEQFRQSQKMESLGLLAGGIAHDFNNILTAIVSGTYLMKVEAEKNPLILEILENISQATQRATDLVKQILTFSRQNKPERKAVNLNRVVLEALNLLRASVPATIRIQTELKETPTVLANATAIHQVIMNLGTNAWHAMHSQPGTLKVELGVMEVDEDFAKLHPELRPGSYVRLSVSDTGRGMDRATLERIFDPFFTTKAVGEGTGLGLAVVHGIMKSHDGAISVYSQPGKGSSFHLYFPVIETKAAVRELEATPVPHGQGEHILLVDDEPALAKLGKKVLERLGYAVTTKTCAQEAIAAVRDQPKPFDVVITDLTMPEMDGITLASQLLQIQPRLAIILMTGYSGVLTAEKVRELGFRDLLPKPSTARVLGETVHRVLHPVA